MPDADGPDLRPSPKQLLGALLALMLLAAAAFHAVPSNGYAFDAIPTVRDNPRVQQGASLVAILATPYWDPEENPGEGLYRPLTTLSFRLTRTLHPLFGKSAMLSSLVRAHGVVRVPMEAEGLARDDEVEVILFGDAIDG